MSTYSRCFLEALSFSDMCEEPVWDRTPTPHPLQPGVILRWSRQGHKHTTLPFVSPDIDRWVTGCSLLQNEGSWGDGARERRFGNQMTNDMTIFCYDNTTKHGVLLCLTHLWQAATHKKHKLLLWPLWCVCGDIPKGDSSLHMLQLLLWCNLHPDSHLSVSLLHRFKVCT